MSEPDFEMDLVRRSGAELIMTLFGLFRTLKVFSLDNKSAQAVVEKFRSLITPFFEASESLDIRLMGNMFFMNGHKVVAGASGYDTLNSFADELARRGIGTLVLHDDFKDEEIAAFVKFFTTFSPSPKFVEDPFEEFSPAFDKLNIQGLSIRKLVSDEEVADAGEEEGEDEVTKYLKSIYIIKRIFERIKDRGKINFKHAKRAVQKLVSAVEKDTEGLVTLLRVEDIREVLVVHSVNVSTYAIMLGLKLGLPKVKVANLGTCGLFHDLGMLNVDPGVINSPGALTQEQWGPIWQHPIEGAKMLLRIDRVVEVVTRSLQVAFEHQMRRDEMGYPRMAELREIDLYSRIVKVADAYDAMTNDRPYRPALPEEEAFQQMLSMTETVYDRILVKMLANIIGVYPIGAKVKLNTGEMGVVQRENPDPDYKDKPTVRIIADAYGQRVDKTVDLMDKEGMVFKYWIVPFDEQELDLDVSDLISIM